MSKALQESQLWIFAFKKKELTISKVLFYWAFFGWAVWYYFVELFFFSPKENECSVWYIPWDPTKEFVQDNAKPVLIRMDHMEWTLQPEETTLTMALTTTHWRVPLSFTSSCRILAAFLLNKKTYPSLQAAFW